MTICGRDDLLALDSTVTRITVSNNCGNEESLDVLDFSRFTYLRELIVGDESYENVNQINLVGLDYLRKVEIGDRSFTEKSGSLIITNCRSLKELTIGNHSFKNYTSIEIANATLLETLTIEASCFLYGNELRLDGLSGLRSVVIGTNSFSSRNGDLYVKNCPLLRELKISSNAMSVFKLFEIESVPLLESLEIGDNCFSNVGIFSLNGLAGLLTVVIGVNSFTNQKNSYGQDTYRHFYLRNCPKVKSLRISRYSFSDYPYCVIESVPSLELIQIGELNLDSKNFYYSSLSLYRCASDHLITTRITQSEECGFWGFIVLPVLQYFLPEF